jgi:hypothetical protein
MKKWSFGSNLALVLLGCGIAGCEADPVPCYPNMKKGARFEVEVVAVADDERADVPETFRHLPSCSLDDVHVGDQLELTLDDLEPFLEGGEGCRSYVCPHNFWTDATPIVNGILDRFYDQVTVDVCRNTLTKVEVSSGCELARNVALYDPLVQGGQAKGHPDEHNPLILARSLSWHPDNAVGYPATDCQDVDQLFPQTRGKSYRCIDTWLVNLSKL